MEDIISSSAGLAGSQVHGDPNTPLALLDDFLDKLYRNLTELEHQQTLSDFFKGSPPKWISYYIAEEQNTPLVRRNGYNDVIKQIMKCQERRRTVSGIKLHHHPGSGGSTLAMQVLWDLRKDFKCATIKPVSTETAVIADHIIKLFEEGGPNDQRTLLLLDDNSSEGNLMENLNMEIVKRGISADVPVAILLNAKRKLTNMADGPLNLKNKLSREELRNFALKEAEMKLSHSDEELKLFHGFNLMRNNFSKKYVANLSSIKEIKDYVKRNKTACNTELFSVLALLNSYVPGSFLPLSRCQDFLNPQRTISEQTTGEMTTLQDPPHMIPGTNMALQIPPDTNTVHFKKDMEPFMNLMVMFSRDETKSECVRLAHPMIANECLKILAEAGITKGEIAKSFLESCKPNEPPYMVKMIKSLLIKRETMEDHQEMFSRLILDIKDDSDLKMCEELFEIATTTFEKDAFFPQAFARFLYIVLHEFDEAEHQACKAIARDPQNSFLRDTLGQIHKKHLRMCIYSGSPAPKILKVAELAIKAFREEEEAAENEQDPNTSNAQSKKVSHTFNCSGLFGYIQVAKYIFDSLTKIDQRWYDVLAGKESICVLPEAEKILAYEDLIENLQHNVERKHAFFESYLIYSKPSRYKSELSHLQDDVDICYSRYLLRHSKPARSCHSIMDRSFPGLFSCLNRGFSSSFLERLTEYARKKHEERMSDVNAAMNYILSNIVLSNKDETSQVLRTLTALRGILWRFVEKQNLYQSPEFFLLVLLLFWPDVKHHQNLHYSIDLGSTVENMKTAFDQKYEKHLRSRYLRPLFFLGQETGLKRLVHSWKVHNVHTKHRKNPKQRRQTWARLDWGNGQLWRDSGIQKLLLRVRGVFRKQQLFAYVEDKEIAIYSDQAFVLYQGPASFFLGFTIKGPVAYDLRFEHDSEGTQEDKFMESQTHLNHCRPLPTCYTCAELQDPVHWEQLHPEVWNEDGDFLMIGSETQECYRISSPAGSYECSVTGLRWVSDSEVILMYHFTDWEPYIEDLKRMQYEPFGPLIDITIVSGVLNEVHLPHFACLGSSPSLNDQVRVLDVQDSGMFLETCELTHFHAKLLHPTFSPKGFLVRTGFPVKVHCEVLIYRTLIAHLTLHIYLVPCDPKMIQVVDKQEKEKDAVKIPKPGPERSLQMRSWYKIETKKENERFSSKIKPERLKLRHSPIKYSEIYIKSAQDDFELHLINEENKSIWDVEIRAEEYGHTSSFPDRPRDPHKEYAVWFVNKHRNALIQRVSLVTPIADDLKSLLGGEKYSIITKCTTPQEQMRKIYFFLSGGQKIEERFYLSLLKNEPHLVGELAEAEAV
ncbi:sterile alpha motif domain-containing protein 9-like [Colossoma macropomum]|uniref:sterile alpha motif domain-containing protein 9-like n=1 Tax=Colossoma macropomum TaxID=42526 RepID=UPI001864081D|nr:sterile alpha motif domain-containing protein 9-like [Colossoma macropomum]XP_036439123.1 sterile alpha motif domain-containing protein 9-like [Colossoma macropomum]